MGLLVKNKKISSASLSLEKSQSFLNISQGELLSRAGASYCLTVPTLVMLDTSKKGLMKLHTYRCQVPA